jgi:hypothetical protein
VDGVGAACGKTPVPLTGFVCGLPAASSVKLTVAAFKPNDVGANFTPTRQLPLGAIALAAVSEQAFPRAGGPKTNCVGSVPVRVMLATFRVPVPVFVMVTSAVPLEVPVR